LIIGVVASAGAVVVLGPRVRASRAIDTARAAMNAKDCAKALEALDGVEGPAAQASFVHEVRAFCLVEREQWARAKEEASAALLLDPSSQALDFRFVASRALGDQRSAEADLGRMFELGRDSVERRVLRAIWRAKRGEWSAAIEDCDLVLAKEPGNLDALNVRSHAWHGLGNWERAYRDAAAQMAIAPTVDGLRDRRTWRFLCAGSKPLTPTSPRRWRWLPMTSAFDSSPVAWASFMSRHQTLAPQWSSRLSRPVNGP
jgi:tetratricopeptide (TPR) repeat protein